MKISAVPRNPSYFDTYINKVDDLDLVAALDLSLAELEAVDLDSLHRLGDQVYAPGKWTVRDIIQHITDMERVFCYRAMSIGRNDTPVLPGCDEDVYAAHAGANTRPLEQALEELRIVRQGTIALFRTFDEAAMRRTGVMFRSELPVLAVGFILVGHQRHHFGVIRERYFPLLG